MIIYTDGSCRKNKKGGWAFVVVVKGRVVHTAYGSVDDCTSNRTELYAIIHAVRYARNKKATIYSDSKYCVSNFYTELPVWQSRDYIGMSGNVIKNAEVWEELRLAMKGKKVDLKWIKSRQKHEVHYEFNKLADSLARIGSEQ